jgi:hypothetical protein
MPNVGDVYEPSKLDVMVTVIVCPLNRLLAVIKSLLRPTREALVPVPEIESAVVRKVTIEVPIVPVALVVKPGGPSSWEVTKSAGELGIVTEVEKSRPRLIAVVDVVKGRIGCGDCDTLLLIVGISPGDDIEESWVIGARGTVEGIKVTVDITTTFPDVTVVVSVIASLTGEGSVGNRLVPVTTGPTKADEDAAGKETGLLVVNAPVLDGGAMLSSHSVVPLMTE